MRIRHIAEHEASGSIKIEYDRLMEAFGIVPNVTKVFSLWPEIFDLHNDMYAKIMVNRTLLPKPIKQFIAVLAAQAASCRYCTIWHTHFLNLMGIDQRIIDALGDDYRQAPVDRKTMSLLEYCDLAARDACRLKESHVQSLRDQGFTDEEILEATVVVGYFGFLTRVLDALGVEVEPVQGSGERGVEST
jgi:uncharacterized peroxidase-related enzyme